MTKRFALFVLVLGCAFATSCRADSQDVSPEAIIALERAALDRWGNGDPQGYLEIMADELTYFDPFQEKRLDGLERMKAFVARLAGTVKVSRFDMQNPKVQFHSDVAVLTFNLMSYAKRPDGKETLAARWNSTEIYRRFEGGWKIVHSHWSYITPELKQPAAPQS